MKESALRKYLLGRYKERLNEFKAEIIKMALDESISKDEWTGMFTTKLRVFAENTHAHLVSIERNNRNLNKEDEELIILVKQAFVFDYVMGKLEFPEFKREDK